MAATKYHPRYKTCCFCCCAQESCLQKISSLSAAAFARIFVNRDSEGPGSPEWDPPARITYCQFATSAGLRGVRCMSCPSGSAAPLSTPLAPYMLSLAPITSLSAYPALALSRHAGAPSYKILLKPGTLSPRKCGAVLMKFSIIGHPPLPLKVCEGTFEHR